MRGLTQQQARNLYGIRNATNLSAGQKAALANASNNQIRQARHDILVDAYNKNAQYKQAYANALMQAGEQQASRDYNAQAAYNDAYIKQNASYVSNLLAHNKNVQSAISQTLQDRSTKEFRDKMYDLWNRSMDNSDPSNGYSTVSLRRLGLNKRDRNVANNLGMLNLSIDNTLTGNIPSLNLPIPNNPWASVNIPQFENEYTKKYGW